MKKVISQISENEKKEVVLLVDKVNSLNNLIISLEENDLKEISNKINPKIVKEKFCTATKEYDNYWMKLIKKYNISICPNRLKIDFYTNDIFVDE